MVTFIRLEGRSQGRVVCCKPDDSMECAAKTRATIIAQIVQVLLKLFVLFSTSILEIQFNRLVPRWLHLGISPHFGRLTHGQTVDFSLQSRSMTNPA